MAACLPVILAGCGTEPPVPEVSDHTDFESGWSLWQADSAATPQIARDTIGFELTDTLDRFGSTCSWMWTDAGPVTLWVEKPFAVEPGRYHVSVSWTAGLPGSFITGLGYVGVDDPEGRDHQWVRLDSLTYTFETYGRPPVEPIDLGLDQTVTVDPDDQLWVAVGYSSGWESRSGICVDDIQVEATQRRG